MLRRGVISRLSPTFRGHSLIASIQTAQSITNESRTVLFISTSPHPQAHYRVCCYSYYWETRRCKVSDVTSRPSHECIRLQAVSSGAYASSIAYFPPTVTSYIIGHCPEAIYAIFTFMLCEQSMFIRRSIAGRCSTVGIRESGISFPLIFSDGSDSAASKS